MSAASRARLMDQRFYGVVEGKVVDNKDDGLKEGRVKVEFPWFNDRMVSEWCRVVQLYAGGGYGAMFTPEEGDEVLVAFIHGDMRLPIVLGGLYNGVDKPPRATGERSDPKFIQTKGGHRVLLDDTTGRRKVEIVDATGSNLLTIDSEANTITLRCQADLTIEATGGRLTLRGSQGVTISGATIHLN